MARTHHRTPDHRLCQADFEHEVKQGNLLVMRDLDKGGRSLTNDIQAALQEVVREDKLNLSNYGIIYRDSDGQWARVAVSEGGRFAGFVGLGKAVYDEAEAERLIRAQMATEAAHYA